VILSILGAATCLTAITTLWPWCKPAPVKSPRQQWQDWEDMRRGASELAQHVTWKPVSDLLRHIIASCEEEQREITDRGREAVKEEIR